MAKRRGNYFERMPKRTIWARRGDWVPSYVHEQQKQPGNEYQHYMYAADNRAMCAGVTRHERMNRATANQILRVWDRWRKEYVAQNPGDYPTAQEVMVPVAWVYVHPIGDQSKGEWFFFGTKD